ncbi:MAG: class I SAM-dependent methyltransferase [Clostridiales bacterium]|nr:class I SAM-dependent methyltransferase [Clostridiales bacterium]
MNDHYYTSSPTSEHRYAPCDYEYRGCPLHFTTDAGVFSRGEVDFGTDVLLNALPDSLYGRVLDLGCGWGAVGVSVGKRWPGCTVVMGDVNERALSLASQNARKNGVTAQTVQSDGLTNIPGEFDFVITNPPIRAGKQVIYGMFRDCAGKLKENGEMYLVIRKQQGAESAIKYLKTIFDEVDTIEKSGGFWVIRCKGGKKDEV